MVGLHLKLNLKLNNKLLNKFKKLTEEKTTISSYAGKNHHHYHGKTLKDLSPYTYLGKYSLADVLEEALEMLLEKNGEI